MFLCCAVYFLSNVKMGQLVKQLPSIAEKRVAIHPLPRALIGVDHLHKCCSSTAKKKKYMYFFNSYMTRGADSHSLTNCVLENNGVPSHSFSTARSAQSELNRVCCFAQPAQACRESNNEALTKTGRQSLFIHIYALMIL